MSYIPATDSDREAMLATIGVSSIEDLFAAIPAELQISNWDMPAPISELSVRNLLGQLADKNGDRLTSFLGGGIYDHHIPAAVDALAGRSEFTTAYTPYQAECAQGALQSIYEYQSAVCRLTEMECANASLYDGGTAVFEAATMSVRLTGRRRIVCDRSVNPIYRKMLMTHTSNLDLEVVEAADGNGLGDAACVIAQNPAFRGSVRDWTALAGECHAAGALFVLSFYPLSLGLLKTPGEMGADIAIAEGQSLGIPLSFGGPYLGIMATRKAHLRKMPGRIAALTEDTEGRRGVVLTLQAREQHIRREKAMSNICTNSALCALRALIYLSLLGKQGLRDVAAQCHAKAEYLKTRLSGVQFLNEEPTFNEFAVGLPRNAAEVVGEMAKRGFLAGIPLSELGVGEPNHLLIAVTEKRTRDEMDTFARVLKEVLCN